LVVVLQALGYVGIASPRLDDWRRFAGGILGMQVVDESHKTVALRMDDRRQRLVIDETAQRGFFGWEVSSPAQLDELANRLTAARVAHEPMSRLDCAQRFVTQGLTVADPVGNRLEVFYGPEVTSDPFVPGREISGFRTGPLGLGHAVLTTDRIEPMLNFYQDILGFSLSDYCLRPFKAYFFHLNARHHSLAIIETGDIGVHHVMVEMLGMDDVGQAYDIANDTPGCVNVTLGRHSNDHMLSFYANTPSDLLVECGWGGRSIDPTTWTPEELTIGPSLWGHERGWLPEDKREEARQMRKDAAALGYRARVHVSGDNYDVADICETWKRDGERPASGLDRTN
jgi:2,3-dihydroxybiphenyl 1,2-dioxygenase